MSCGFARNMHCASATWSDSTELQNLSASGVQIARWRALTSTAPAVWIDAAIVARIKSAKGLLITWKVAPLVFMSYSSAPVEYKLVC